MTVFSLLLLLTYFLVVSGFVYDVIVEPPGIVSNKNPSTDSVRPVIFLPLALDKNRSRSVKVSFATAGICSVAFTYVMSMS